MQPNAAITPSTLSVKDLPWQILWHKDKCTLCGRCTAVCPVNAIELGVFRKRRITVSLEPQGNPASSFEIYHGIRQKTDPAYACVGCATCSLVCPNDAIFPMRSDEADKLRYHINRGGQPAAGAAGATRPAASWTRSSLSASPCSPTRPWMPDAMNSKCAPCWAGFCRRNKT
jgi:ferredoxin